VTQKIHPDDRKLDVRQKKGPTEARLWNSRSIGWLPQQGITWPPGLVRRGPLGLSGER
jgi:hypothetical protein